MLEHGGTSRESADETKGYVMSKTETEESEETLVVAFMGTDGRAALQEAAAEATHLKAMWEKLRLGQAEGVDFVGVPIGNKVNDDSIENHSRHLHSLLHLMGVPLTKSHMDITKVVVPEEILEPIPEPEPEGD